MKNKLILFIILTIIAAVPVGAIDGNGFPYITPYDQRDDFGNAVHSAATHETTVCYDENGRALLCFGVQGGLFFAVDVETGEIADKFSFDSGYIYCDAIATAANGKVYLDGYPAKHLYVYDPVKHTFEGLEANMFSDGQMESGCADDEGNVFFGTYSSSGAKLYGLNTQTNAVTDYGILNDVAHYISSMTADENYIYCGMGVAPYTSIIRVNKKTKEKATFASVTSGSYFELKQSKNKLLVRSSGGITVIDKATMTVEYTIAATAVIEGAPFDDTSFYGFNTSNKLIRLTEGSSAKTEIAANPLTVEMGAMACEWAKLKSGDWVVTVVSRFMEQMGYINPQTGESKVFSFNKADIPDSGPQVNSLEISPDGIIYMGGYQTAMSAFDINKNEFIYDIQDWKQNEGAGFLNGKTYFGTYTGAVIWSFDPKKEMNYTPAPYGVYQGHDANPALVYDIEEHQDRPFVLKGYKDKLYIGTFPGYGQLGGALVIYWEDEEGIPQAKTFRNVIPDQAIAGLAVRDNLVYLSGTIRGGLGIDPTETEAKISVFDTETEKVIKTVTPDLPGIGTSSVTIGELSFGPDGNLWGVSNLNGLVFAMDPETLEVEKYVEIAPGDDRGALARPLYLRWGEDGLLYTTAAWVVTAVNPGNMKTLRIAPNCSLMTLDPWGDVWLGKGKGFMRQKINKADRLKLIIENTDLSAYSDKGKDELLALMENGRKLAESGSEKEIADISEEIIAVRNSLYKINDHIKNFKGEIDNKYQTLKISGFSEKGERLEITVRNPNGDMVMYDVFTPEEEKEFSKVYRIDPLMKGEYSIYFKTEGMENKALRKVSAAPAENTMLAETFMNEDLSFGGRISNFYAYPRKIRFAYARFASDGKLIEVKTELMNIPAGEFRYFEGTGEKKDGEWVKLLLWDNMKPVVPGIIR